MRFLGKGMEGRIPDATTLCYSAKSCPRPA